MHAEDQMMSVEVIRALAEEMIEMCSELKKQKIIKNAFTKQYNRYIM